MDLRTIMLRPDRFAQTSATRRPRTQLPDPRLVLKTKVSMEDRPLASKIANFFSSPLWRRTLSACLKTANFPMVSKTVSKMPNRAVPTNWSLQTSLLSSETRWSNSWVISTLRGTESRLSKSQRISSTTSRRRTVKVTVIAR